MSEFTLLYPTPCLSDLTPTDYNWKPKVMKKLNSQHYITDDGFMKVVDDFLKGQDVILNRKGIRMLQHSLTKCVILGDDCVENLL